MVEVAIVAATAAGRVAGTLLDLILNPIWNRITSVFKFEDDVKNMKDNVRKLEAERESRGCCNLRVMLSHKGLMSLEVLSFSGCDIEELPMEISQLTQLELLDLSDCAKLKVIQPHVFACLSRLEELYLGNSFNQWSIGENGKQRNASLAELKDLPNLAALDVHVCDVRLIPEDLFSERLNRYKIFVGEMWNHWDSSFKSSKVLKLELNSLNYDHSIGMLLKKIEELHLKELKGFKNVVYELDAEGFQKLKYLCIQNAAEVQHIINSVEWVLCSAFPDLESLLLLNLNNLVKICHGQPGATSFSKLSISLNVVIS